MISKRIEVKDSGEPPYLIIEPKLDWYLGESLALEIPFSDYADPENEFLFFSVKLR